MVAGAGGGLARGSLLEARHLFLVLVALLATACGGGPQPPPLDSFAVALSEDVAGVDLQTVPRYHLEVLIQPEQATLAARATVHYVNRAPAELREVYFRLYPNMRMFGGSVGIVRASVDGHDVPFVVAGKGADLKVPLPRTLLPGRATAIEVDFTVRYPEIKGEYDFFGTREGVVLLPDFYPMLAPLIAGEWRLDPSPGFGDAAFSQISLYQLDVTVPAGYQVIAPGAISGPIPSGTGLSYHIVTGLARNIGLVAGRNYERQEEHAEGMALIGYAFPQNRTASAAALSHASGAVAYCQDRLGPHSNRQLVLVEAPVGQASVHLSGMVLVSSRYYGEDRPLLSRAVAEGVVRQWWGDKVASDPLRDAWIDESLVGITTFLYLRTIRGAATMAPVLDSWRQAYERAKATGLDGPLAQPLAAYGNSARYELLVGSKGPLFWYEMGELLGEDGLWTVMRRLQEQYAYGFLDTASLNATLSRLAGTPAIVLSEEWGVR